MPFKSSKISYGLPQDDYPKERMNDCITDFKEVLGLKSELVGVRFIFDESEYAALEADEPSVPIPYCVMVKSAVQGKTLKSRLMHHKCDGGTTALGLERSTQRIENGAEYFSYNLYASQAAARRHRTAIKSLHAYEPLTYGILICPFKDCTKAPDVVIGIVNAFQAMRIVQGNTYESGIKPKIDMGAMQGICSEATIVPYITGEINVSVLCPSTRMLCKWDESDIAVGIPFERFETIVRGIMATQMKY
ncbi:MAG: DUF169 domain-containing protein [Oscillospiraceae bacterium]|nr:DUF169 domain-containing protein [Oscillospiraceae bacterium]